MIIDLLNKREIPAEKEYYITDVTFSLSANTPMTVSYSTPAATYTYTFNSNYGFSWDLSNNYNLSWTSGGVANYLATFPSLTEQ